MRVPRASGLLAALDGKTLQVQSATTQTAVPAQTDAKSINDSDVTGRRPDATSR